MSKIKTSAYELSRYEKRPLDAIFTPRHVAVIGATEREGSVGRSVMENLLEGPFEWSLYPVNLRRREVFGHQAYRSVTDLPEPIDLALIALPAPAVPQAIRECVEAGVLGAIIFSSGFRESGPEGAILEQQVIQEARKGGLRILGPNTLGIINPRYGLNATFARAPAKPGNVAFVSQSGAMCSAVLDWSHMQNVGFSHFVSIGSMADLGWADLIYYLGDDYNTKSILIYMESVGDARSFLSAAREVALTKPIIILKTGRTPEAARAAFAHIGSITGKDEVLDAAFRRSGVLRVNRMVDLFYMAEALAKQPRPRGPKLTIVTNAGGPAILATDALISEGGQLTPLSADTEAELDAILPPQWSHGNPIDILGDATRKTFDQAIKIAASEKETDGLMVILTPQDMTDVEGVAEDLKDFAAGWNKPVLTSWMGGKAVEPGRAVLNAHNIPTFPYPDTAMRVFNNMWRYTRRLRELYETPQLPEGRDEALDTSTRIAELIQAVRASGKQRLGVEETEQLLAAYNLPYGAATTAVPHQLTLTAYPDPQFGPILTAGARPDLRLLYHDFSLGIPPLTTTLARRLLERTRSYQSLLKHPQAGDLPLGEIDDVVVRFSQLIAEQRRIERVELLLGISPDGIHVRSAAVDLYAAHVPEDEIPKLAIRPYPIQYVSTWQLRDGTPVIIRPIRPEDEPLIVEFHNTLSDQTVYLRYFQNLSIDYRISHERLTRICFIDYDLEIALVVETTDTVSGARQIIGVARMRKLADQQVAEYASVISDTFQRQGIGTKLLKELIELAPQEEILQIDAYTLPENLGMQRVFEKLGFEFSREDGMLKASLQIGAERENSP